MARPLTSEHISAGTLEKGLSSATGCSVAKDSQGAMSFRGTEGPTQVSCYLRLRLLFLLSSPVLTNSHTGRARHLTSLTFILLLQFYHHIYVTWNLFLLFFRMLNSFNFFIFYKFKYVRIKLDYDCQYF